MWWVVALNFYIAAGAATVAWAHACRLAAASGRPVAPEATVLAVVVFLGTLGVYNLGRVAAGMQAAAEASPRRRWIAKHPRAVHRLGKWSAIAGGVLGIVLLPPTVLGTLAAAGAVAGGYYLCLRRVPGIKPLTVGVAWGLATAVAPAALTGADWGSIPVIRLSVSTALFIAGLTLPFDIRDAQDDRQQGLATLATTAGPGTVRVVASIVLAPAGAFAGYDHAAGWAAIAAVCVALLASPRRPDAFYSVGLDGLVFAWAAATWADAILVP